MIKISFRPLNKYRLIRMSKIETTERRSEEFVVTFV